MDPIEVETSRLLFSIVIPTYNRLHYLKECLESVRAQKFRDFEVIVVDDGSTDGTADYIASIRDLPLRTVAQRNRGPGAARNLGARLACGEYLAFLDSDDLWPRWTLQTYMQAISSNQKPSMVVAALEEFTSSDLLETHTAGEYQIHVNDCFLSTASEQLFVGAGMLVVRRDIFLEAGGFVEDKINAEDHDLALRLGLQPGFVVIKAPYTLAYRRHSGNETNDNCNNTEGILRLVARERDGYYPGGGDWKGARRAIIATHARSAIISGLRKGQGAPSWDLLRHTIVWQVQSGRWRFLCVAGALLVVNILRVHVFRLKT